MVEPEILLKNFNLSQTQVRTEIIKILMESALALSMTEIRQRFQTPCDRVTLYRNLKTFTQRGLIHQIFIDNQDSKYVLPENVVEPDKNYTEHLHFKCIRCNLVKCLHEMQVGAISLPEGYKMLETNFVVFGLCNECNN